MTLSCATESRRALVRERGVNGIDSVEVDDAGPTLCVRLFGPIPTHLTLDDVRIEGGRRIRDLRVVDLTVDGEDHDGETEGCLRLTLDRVGDFSPYRVRLLGRDAEGHVTDAPPAGFDARYASATFRFRIDCAGDVDCKATELACPEPRGAVAIDYLARDYASLRRVLLDRLAVAMPDWQERHAPDLGVALVELFAYVGDYLSYHQDSVGTEAYLQTARRRVSVRRHARLVDYALHEGCNARVFLVLTPEVKDLEVDLRNLSFVTSTDALSTLPSGILTESVLAGVQPADYETFEPLFAPGAHTIKLARALSEVAIYTWGDSECTLPAGATRATLVRTWGDAKLLQPGELLLLEETKGPGTGLSEDADPTRRWFVRVTRATAIRDPLTETDLLEVEWDAVDALPFPLCLSTLLPAPACKRVSGLAVARGNVILADHGRRREDDLGTVPVAETLADCDCPDSPVDIEETPGAVRPRLPSAHVVHRHPLPARPAAARELLTQDPRGALPVAEVEVREAAQLADGAPVIQQWMPALELLTASARARRFVVEVEEDRSARLRFGDGEHGARPPARAALRARYRTGVPEAGNVEAETLTRIVSRIPYDAALRVRNPLPARGGIAPESLARAKLAIPQQYRRDLERAVTADDYAQLASEEPRLQRAAAALDWTGSWYEARVAADPREADALAPALAADVDARLAPYRRLGHDVRVIAPRYVPLTLRLTVCVKRGYLRGHVLAEVRAQLSDEVLPDGRLGFFHPDALSFGQAVAVSAVVARVQAVAGVENVVIAVLRRRTGPEAPALPPDGTLRMAPDEIAQLAADPDFGERGELTIEMGGGR